MYTGKIRRCGVVIVFALCNYAFSINLKKKSLGCSLHKLLVKIKYDEACDKILAVCFDLTENFTFLASIAQMARKRESC